MAKFRIRTPRTIAIAAAGAAVAVAAVAAAVLVFLTAPPRPQPSLRVELPPMEKPAPGKPWFRRQSGPPEFLTHDPRATPPLMPHDDHDDEKTSPPRAYEEALPETVHLTPPADFETSAGPAPIPRDDDVPPWRKFAVDVPPDEERNQIAIVIDDAGIDRKRTARAIALPGPLTIAFLTYAGALKRQSAAAREAGHELLVHVSMEPMSDAVDPGPNALRADQGVDVIRKKLSWGLARFEGYVGINNHMGSRFTTDETAMTVVMETLRERGLMFLDSRTAQKTVGPRLAREFEVPLAERNVFLDNKPTPENLARQLAELERVAERQGHAVAIGHPRDATLDALEEWLLQAAEKGIQLVPISAIAARRLGVSLAESR